mgnify:FL=1
MISALVILAIWMTIDAANNNKEIEIQQIQEEMINEVIDDTLSFNEMFELQYLKHGEGHVFEWNGKEYLTNLEK